MKKYTRCRIAGIFAACSLGLGTLTGVTINNPGFESDFSGWNDIDPSAISSSDVHSGSKSAKITGSGGRVEQSVSVDSNTDYVLKAWVYEYGTIGAEAGSNDYSDGGNFGSFTEVSVSFNSGSNSSVTIYCEYNGGTGRFDDFTLEEDSSGGGWGGDGTGSSELCVLNVDASSDDGNVPSNTIDDDFETRWSAEGDGEWIRYELEDEGSIDAVDIAWYNGDQREADFDIQTSTDGSTWTTVFSGNSSGTTTGFETYDVDNTTADWVRIVGYGNTSNNWNSITEVEIWGDDGCDGSGGSSQSQYYEPEDIDPLPNGWEVLSDGSASNNEYVNATSSNTSSVPSDGTLTFDFSLDEAMTVAVWVRVITDSTSSDSCWIQDPDASSYDQWYSGWTHQSTWYWRKRGEFSLGSGNHDVRIKYRESDFKLDQVLVTSDLDLDPGDSDLDPNLPPGDNFDLSTWKITFPDGSEEKEDWLTGGGESEDEFYTDPNNGGMVFRCPNISGSTSGSSYSRTEFREMLRAGDTSISTTGLNENNWVFSSSTQSNQDDAGGVDGTLTATITVDEVSSTGEDNKVGRVIVGQIHASDDEPCRLYYRKLPDNSKGSIYFAHEPTNSSEEWYEMIGSRSDSASNPSDGIELGEEWSYEIDVQGDTLTVTIMREGKSDVVETVDMSNSGFEDDWMYFKAGCYNQNNTGDESDYVQVTFFDLSNVHY